MRLHCICIALANQFSMNEFSGSTYAVALALAFRSVNVAIDSADASLTQTGNYVTVGSPRVFRGSQSKPWFANSIYDVDEIINTNALKMPWKAEDLRERLPRTQCKYNANIEEEP